MSMSSSPFLETGPLAFAHQGGAVEFPPGNSMRAFHSAADLGYRFLETDVRASSDGVLVLIHDREVPELPAPVDELSWHELQQHTIGGEPIARLDELLETFPNANVNIDPKHDGAVGPLVELIELRADFRRVAFATFSDVRHRRLAQLVARRSPVSLNRFEVARLKLASYGVPVGRVRRAPAQIPRRHWRIVPVADGRFLREARNRDVPVHVWTIDDEQVMHELLDQGATGIMTDRPSLLKKVLIDRGAWQE